MSTSFQPGQSFIFSWSVKGRTVPQLLARHFFPKLFQNCEGGKIIDKKYACFIIPNQKYQNVERGKIPNIVHNNANLCTCRRVFQTEVSFRTIQQNTNM